jgi:hypothetical protein
MDLMDFDNSIGGAHAMCPYRWNSLISLWDLVLLMAEGCCWGKLGYNVSQGIKKVVQSRSNTKKNL